MTGNLVSIFTRSETVNQKFELKMNLIFCVTLGLIISNFNADSSMIGMIERLEKVSSMQKTLPMKFSYSSLVLNEI